MQYDSSPWQNDLFGTSNQGAILTGSCFGISIETFFSQMTSQTDLGLRLN